ncbi:polyprenyl synthetase family protein [Massilia sp. YIM B02763]|uniref:polyprenyl synthetase family protein n=1 Tax=Massilia sp. YIM B02763 TaxID=3050130 RepID=UPI0025B700C3|nr:polyprenyl synthetase family protein [Massilia sp. YIM B02763]MDN4055537.1 polyprenyl synthetase family protein [Massilia sp. YIM B02763]
MIKQTWRFDGLDGVEDLDALRRDIEDRMAALLADSDKADLLTHAMRAGTLGAGKRMRPLLLMLVARDLGCDSPALVDVGCAVEMVHAASLILDDMPCMDDARLRRGKPAIHVAYGEDIAILASVALLSRAFCILSAAEDIPPAVRTRLVCALGETVGTQGLVRGQFLDLHGGARSAAEIAETNELKTGVLLGAAVDMAAIVAEADERTARSLRAFALAAGQAFQIRDDFQDGPGNDSAVTGKDTGKDAGKATFVNTLGVEEARRRLLAHLVEAERHLDAAVGARQGTRQFVRSLFGQALPAARAGDAARPSRAQADGIAAARA